MYAQWQHSRSTQTLMLMDYQTGMTIDISYSPSSLKRSERLDGLLLECEVQVPHTLVIDTEYIYITTMFLHTDPQF